MTKNMSNAGGGPTSSVDPFDDANLSNPHPFHHALREAGPAVYLEKYGVYALGRYHDVRSALHDWQTFQSGAGVGLYDYRVDNSRPPAGELLEADPPQHDAGRAAMEKVLGPRSLAKLRTHWFEQADEFVDDALSRSGEEFDAVEVLSRAFPMQIFPDALGLPRAGRENLLPFADFVFNDFGPRNERVTQGEIAMGTVAGWFMEHSQREKLTNDGFGAAVWAATDKGDIMPGQAPILNNAMLAAGMDTTVHGLGALLLGFARFPEQWHKLVETPALASNAFYEAVRWQSPVQTFFRTATRDITVGDFVVPEGKKILLFLGSANRDPRRWSNPDDFDISRDSSGHVGFGAGVHQCVGQHVARLEAEALLAALIRRISHIELAGEPVPHLNNTLRALESLPVRVTMRVD